MRPLIAAAIGLMLLTGCEDASDTDEVHTDLPPCGSYSSSFISVTTIHPAVDEGDGKVGLLTESSNGHLIEDDEFVGAYQLYDCRSGNVVGFDAYRDLSIPYDAPNRPPTLEEFVQTARQNGLMAQPDRLLAQARRAGFRPGTVDQSGSSEEYATCACQHFYPDIAPLTKSGNAP